MTGTHAEHRQTKTSQRRFSAPSSGSWSSVFSPANRQSNKVLMLDEALQPGQRAIPLHRDLLEILPCLGKALLFELPDALPSDLRAADQPGIFHHAQVLGDRLTRDVEAAGQPGDRQRPSVAETRDQAKPGLVPQRGKDRSRARSAAFVLALRVLGKVLLDELHLHRPAAFVCGKRLRARATTGSGRSRTR